MYYFVKLEWKEDRHLFSEVPYQFITLIGDEKISSVWLLCLSAELWNPKLNEKKAIRRISTRLSSDEIGKVRKCFIGGRLGKRYEDFIRERWDRAEDIIRGTYANSIYNKGLEKNLRYDIDGSTTVLELLYI